MLYASMATKPKQESILRALAIDDLYWRVTGMEAIAKLAGITRKDVIKNEARAVNTLMEFALAKTSPVLVTEAVLKLLQDRDLGLAGVPPADTRTNGTSIIRDLVNPRTKEYRTYFPLPGLHWGSCQCCSSNSHLAFIKRLGTLKGLDEGQTKSILQEVFASNDNLAHPTLLAEVFSLTSDDVMGSLLHVVDGPGNLQLMQYCISPRRSQKGSYGWSIQPYCLECMRRYEDPETAIRAAHTFKLLAKVRHEMMIAGRDHKKISAAYRQAVKDSQAELEAASSHLKMAERVVDLHPTHGRTVQQRSSNFTATDEDALAREAHEAGLHNEVIKGRKKTDLWRIRAQRPGKGKRIPVDSINRLRNLIDATKAMKSEAAASLNVDNVLAGLYKEEEE